MSELRLAARLARREVRRRPGRTALVAVLVAVPVGFMVFSLVFLRTEDVTQAEAWQSDYGDADVIVPTGEDIALPDLPGVPPGAPSMAVEETYLRVATAGGERREIEVRGLPADDPLADGLVDLVAGRFPAAAGEVALAPHVADDLGVGVGDRLALERPADLDLAVVGLVEKPGELRRPLALTAPGGALLDADPQRPAVSAAYVDVPAAAIEDLRGTSGLLVRGDFIEDAEGISDPLVIWVYVMGAVVLTVVGIVIAAAFAAGARRQLVVLGQLSASGAPARLLRTTLVLQGTVTGLVGAVAGAGLTLGFLLTNRPLLQEMHQNRFARYDIRPAEVAGAVIVGVAAASIAALIPAWSVAHVSTLSALAGRRPLRPVRRRVTAAGGVAFAAGLGLLGLAVLGGQTGEDAGIWGFVAVVGGVLELLGACAMAPAVVARLERLAGVAGGSWRLAARSLARERARTGAVVSAVAAAGGLAVASTALVVGDRAGDAARPGLSDAVVVASEVVPGQGTVSGPNAGPGGAVPLDADARAELARLLPDAEQVTVHAAGTDADWFELRAPVVADPAVLDGFGLGAGVRRALDDSGLVALGPGDQLPDRVTLPDGRTHDVVVVPSHRSLGDDLPGVLISPALVDEIGVDRHAAGVAFVGDRALTAEEIEGVAALRDDWLFEQSPSSLRTVSAPWPRPGPSALEVELILAAVALAFAVLVVGASLALAASESRDERDVLTVAGVAPRTLARSAGGKAWLLAAIGAAMAVPVGLLPVVVFVAADDGAMLFRVPWRVVALLAVALPAACAVVAFGASATTQRLRPVRVSTAVFE